MGSESNGRRRLTRRRVLKAGATALGGGNGSPHWRCQDASAQAQAPAVLTGTQTGRTFRGLVRHGSDARRAGDAAAADRPAAGRHPLAGGRAVLHDRARRARHQRRSAAPRCPTTAASAWSRPSAPMVKRVQVGDRVVVAGTSQCGQCYQCLHGRPDYCQFTFFSNAPGVEPFAPFAEFRDGTPVYAQAGIGGMSEIMTAFEEYCVPVFTDLPAAQLTLLGDQLASGFAAGHADMHFQPGSDVVVFGCGPGRSRRRAGRACHGRRPGDRDRSDQVPPRVRAEARRHDDARSRCRRRRHRRARARAVPGSERSAVRRRRRRGAARATPSCRAARTSSSRPRAFRRFRRRSKRSPIPTNVKTVQQAWDCTAHGRARDADGIHAAAGVVSRHVAGAARPDDSPGPAGRPARHARHPALREADREGDASTRSR